MGIYEVNEIDAKIILFERTALGDIKVEDLVTVGHHMFIDKTSSSTEKTILADIEHSFDEDWAKLQGLDTSNLVVLESWAKINREAFHNLFTKFL